MLSLRLSTNKTPSWRATSASSEPRRYPCTPVHRCLRPERLRPRTHTHTDDGLGLPTGARPARVSCDPPATPVDNPPTGPAQFAEAHINDHKRKEVRLDGKKPPRHSLSSRTREECPWLSIPGTPALFSGIRTQTDERTGSSRRHHQRRNTIPRSTSCQIPR